MLNSSCQKGESVTLVYTYCAKISIKIENKIEVLYSKIMNPHYPSENIKQTKNQNYTKIGMLYGLKLKKY
jgi:hypothetical protein